MIDDYNDAMDGIKDEADARREEAEAASATGTPEIAATSRAFYVAGGWVPVSSVLALLEKWEAEAAANNWNGHYRAAQYGCIADLRAELERATVRQPAPNVEISHDPERRKQT